MITAVEVDPSVQSSCGKSEKQTLQADHPIYLTKCAYVFIQLPIQRLVRNSVIGELEKLQLTGEPLDN